MSFDRHIDSIFAAAGRSPAAAAHSNTAENGRTGPVSRSQLGKNEKRDPRLSLTPLADLLSEPVEEAPWLVEELLPQGGLSILAGKPKAGKSTLARCIALAVAAGRPVVGRGTAAGPVIYLGHEDKRTVIAEHFRAMGPTGSEPLQVHTGPAPAPSDKAVWQLGELIREHGAVLAIIDTMLRFVRVKDVADYAVVTAALDPLLVLSRESGCHIMAVYHAGKTERDGLDAIRGSVAIAGSCDTGMILRRRGDGIRTLTAVQRCGPDLPETVLDLDPTTRNVLTGMVLADRERADTERAVLDAIGDGERTEAEIRGAVGGNTGQVVRVLRELLKAGTIARNGKGRANGPYRYRVAGESAADSGAYGAEDS